MCTLSSTNLGRPSNPLERQFSSLRILKISLNLNFTYFVQFIQTAKLSPGMPSNPLEKQFALLGTASTAGLLDVQKAYRFFLYIRNCFRFMKLIRRVSEWPLRIMVMLSGGQSSYTI